MKAALQITFIATMAVSGIAVMLWADSPWYGFATWLAWVVLLVCWGTLERIDRLERRDDCPF